MEFSPPQTKIMMKQNRITLVDSKDSGEPQPRG